jgi:hypothetical protein
MTVLGQTRRFRDVRRMSGLRLGPDVYRPSRHFAFVPKAVVKLCDDQACVTIRSDFGYQLSARVGPAVVDVSPSAPLAAVGSPI